MSAMRYILLMGSALLFLTSCSIHQQATDLNNSLLKRNIPIPTYVAGEYFKYDNGNQRTVSAVSKSFVTWETGDTSQIVTSNDFTLPPMSWDNPNSKSTTKTNVTTTGLWPLKLGGKVTFTSKQQIVEKPAGTPREILRKWTCEVESVETVKVPVGTYDTFKISCSRYSGEDGGWRGQVDYYYSPDVGHPILIKSKSRSSGTRVQKLTEVGFNSNFLQEKDKASLKKAFNGMLNKSPDGEAVYWRSSNKKVSLLLAPITSYTDQTKRECRTYSSIYSVEGRTRTHNRDYCKDDKKKWQRVR